MLLSTATIKYEIEDLAVKEKVFICFQIVERTSENRSYFVDFSTL